LSKAQWELTVISTEFACTADAMKATNRFENRQRFYQLAKLSARATATHGEIQADLAKDSSTTQCYIKFVAHSIAQQAIATNSNAQGALFLPPIS